MRIIPFGVIWLVFSLIYTILEKGLLGDLNHYPSTGNPYNFSRNIFVTPVAALVTGKRSGGARRQTVLAGVGRLAPQLSPRGRDRGQTPSDRGQTPSH